MLSKGDEAPDFTVETTQGSFTLSDADGPVVLFFFPKAGSKVCTKEACSFRDSLDAFDGHDATVLGVSTNDDLDRLHGFADENDLDYPLTSDRSGELSERYGLSGFLGLSQKAKRATFVVEDGEVIGVTKGLLSAEKHVDESLEAIGET
ncbi:peroxiredoxin [Haladaptatus sp. F3-133]|jgi:peroxiredoxin Q/BCP|uniref:thioredoxin-dependent peroxiredoxin n=1 Tax=Halorutilus salinus TaxID=2487751 RepID=A0A9Q4C4K8_9EURY|nr:peroxiredoxin [Halorutilus salinus]MCX2819041.1 peroxiredoxin [Halorutilus salinus]